MKNCQACGNVQDAGNFCAKCGGKLTEITTSNNRDNTVPTEQRTQPTSNFQQPSQPTSNFQQPSQPTSHFQQPSQPTPNFQQPSQSTPDFQQPSQPTPDFHQPGQPPFQQQPFQQHQQFQQQGQQAEPTQPNVHVERVKDQSKQFLNYFTTYIKQPSTIFSSGESQFTNGLIAIIAYAIIIGLALFTFVYKLSGGWYPTSSIFFNVFVGSSLFILAMYAVIVISLLIVAKGFGPGTTWKEFVSFLGTFSIPSIILSILSLFFFIISMFDLGNWLFIVSLLLVISAIPLFIIARLLTIKTKGLDSFYAYLVYIVIFSILFYVLSSVIWNNTVGKFMNSGFW